MKVVYVANKNEKGGASAWKNRDKLRIASDGEAPVPLNKMNSK